LPTRPGNAVSGRLRPAGTTILQVRQFTHETAPLTRPPGPCRTQAFESRTPDEKSRWCLVAKAAETTQHDEPIVQRQAGDSTLCDQGVLYPDGYIRVLIA
jgi:hypothetical protein